MHSQKSISISNRKTRTPVVNPVCANVKVSQAKRTLLSVTVFCNRDNELVCTEDFFITYVDGSRRSKAISVVCGSLCVCLCVRLCVFPHDKSKMAVTKNHQTWHRDSPS